MSGPSGRGATEEDTGSGTCLAITAVDKIRVVPSKELIMGEGGGGRNSCGISIIGDPGIGSTATTGSGTRMSPPAREGSNMYVLFSRRRNYPFNRFTNDAFHRLQNGWFNRLRDSDLNSFRDNKLFLLTATFCNLRILSMLLSDI